MTAYEEHATTTSHELERLRHDNAVHNTAIPPSELDCELKFTYRHLSEAEHGWNYTHQLLDIAHEEVDILTNGIIHLEHAYKPLGAELEERAEMIANLEQ
jgi:hypothetical protein